MIPPRGFRSALLPVVLVVLWGCGGSDSPTGCDGNDCGAALPTFPQRLSSLDTVMARGVRYEPRYPLWSDGLVKERRMVLPDGGTVSTADRAQWVFPDGTRIFKTFSVTDDSSPSGVRPVETRLMVKVNGRWEFGVYLWRADGTDAELQSGLNAVPVVLEDAEGRSFIHQVPSVPQCGLCHLTNPTTVLGFDELQLGTPLGGTGGSTQLQLLFQSGILDGNLPADPESVAGSDPMTRDLIGYFNANCSFCHNAKTLPAGLDLTHPVFLANTVNQPGLTGGILIKPGDPEGSLLYQRFVSGEMPALGVQLGDSVRYEQLREWILTHDFGVE